MNLGTKIVRSCELVENIWMQIEDLTNSLSAMTESALKEGVFKNVQSAGSSTSNYETGASGWSYQANSISFPVMQKRRRRVEPAAWINYQISVFGNGIPPLPGDGNETSGPALHISFWNHETDFSDPQMSVTFPSEWEGYDIKDRRLIHWASEKEGEYPQWTFSIQLLELNSEDAIERSVIAPIKALLANEELAVALPADLPGLIFYADFDRGEAGRELVAIESSGAPV